MASIRNDYDNQLSDYNFALNHSKQKSGPYLETATQFGLHCAEKFLDKLIKGYIPADIGLEAYKELDVFTKKHGAVIETWKAQKIIETVHDCVPNLYVSTVFRVPSIEIELPWTGHERIMYYDVPGKSQEAKEAVAMKDNILACKRAIATIKEDLAAISR